MDQGAIRRQAAVLLTTSCIWTVLVLAPRDAQADSSAQCPIDSVASGNVCLDKYEASVWRTRDAHLIRKIRQGTASLRELRARAVQIGVTNADYEPGCHWSGSGCRDLYAVSIRGVLPSTYITWFQAAAAARNAGKRLPTNAEWQAAALGTPDLADDGATTCNTAVEGSTVATGSRSTCVSDVGAFDMVGNMSEWVADWVARSTSCTTWDNSWNDDLQCLSGAATEGSPGAVQRGGSVGEGSDAGVYAINASYPPNMDPHDAIGFRAVR